MFRKLALRVLVLALALTFLGQCSRPDGKTVWAAPLEPQSSPSAQTAGQFGPQLGLDCSNQPVQGWSQWLPTGSLAPFLQDGTDPVQIPVFEFEYWAELRGLYALRNPATGACSLGALLEVYGSPEARGLWLAVRDADVGTWTTERVAEYVDVTGQTVAPEDATGMVMSDGRLLVAYTAGYPSGGFSKIAFRSRNASGTWQPQVWADEGGEEYQFAPQIGEGVQLSVELSYNTYRQVGGYWKLTVDHISHLGQEGQVRDFVVDVPNQPQGDGWAGQSALVSCGESRCLVWSDGVDLRWVEHTPAGWTAPVQFARGGYNPVACGDGQFLSWTKSLGGVAQLERREWGRGDWLKLASFSLLTGDPMVTRVDSICQSTAEGALSYGHTVKLASGELAVRFGSLQAGPLLGVVIPNKVLTPSSQVTGTAVAFNATPFTTTMIIQPPVAGNGCGVVFFDVGQVTVPAHGQVSFGVTYTPSWDVPRCEGAGSFSSDLGLVGQIPMIWTNLGRQIWAPIMLGGAP